MCKAESNKTDLGFGQASSCLSLDVPALRVAAEHGSLDLVSRHNSVKYSDPSMLKLLDCQGGSVG